MNNPLPSINLVVQNGIHAGQVFTIQGPLQIIGRGSGSNVIITDKSLSRRHAQIKTTPHGYVIEDLGSTNGTYINDKQVTGSAPIRPGDTIRLGSSVTVGIQLQPGTMGHTDNQETLAPSSPLATGDRFDPTMIPGGTVVPGGTPEAYPPAAPIAPAMPVAPIAQPQRQGINPWLWVIAAVIVALLIIAGTLGFLRFSTLSQPAPTEIAQPPGATPTVTASPTSPPTYTPIPATTSAPTGPSPTSEQQVEIVVAGIPAAMAAERQAPSDISAAVDPFCNDGVEVNANEPVFINWVRLVADDTEANYQGQWLESTYYDIRLDGRPITELGSLHYDQDQFCNKNGLCGPAFNWWINVGLLDAGSHYLSLEWYTNKTISNGLDVEPTDGQVDSFGPGLAGKGFCNIVVVQAATSTPQASPTSPTTSIPTRTPTPVQLAAAPLGIFQDFESQNAWNWKRGDQPYGEFTRSTIQVHSGSYAGQFSYNFPSADNDYVVFLQSRRLAGRPNAISIWVYGDNSGHFLNVWIKDANDQSWQMSFGQLEHTGWREMTAILDPGQPWPSGHISGPNNGVIDYPISFQALVVDDGSDDYKGRGTIYLDDLNSQEGVVPPTATPTRAGGGQQVATPTPNLSGPYVLALGGQHRYEEPWGSDRGDPCEAWKTGNFDDKHPNFRGFNVEFTLTNNSQLKIQDSWGENLRFITANGQEVKACYYGYAGSGPPPKASSSVTFFTVVPQGDFVQVAELTLNNQTIRICLNGSGGWSYC